MPKRGRALSKAHVEQAPRSGAQQCASKAPAPADPTGPTSGQTRTKALALAGKATVEWADILANADVFGYAPRHRAPGQ